MNSFLNPIELLKSAAATLTDVPREFGAEHANVLQLERAADFIEHICDESGKTPDEAVQTLGYIGDKAMNHIA